ncbi:hypothetical protein ACU686_39600 [Yinghuangia aomiensis]
MPPRTRLPWLPCPSSSPVPTARSAGRSSATSPRPACPTCGPSSATRTAAPLRAAGARVSVGDLSDPLRLGAVLEGAYTVVHLDTGPDGTGTPLDTWDWLLDAAEDTGLRRIVTVLPPGTAAPESPYETVVVPGPDTAPDAEPDPALVAALAAADRRG